MRRLVDLARLRSFIEAFGGHARRPATVYLTGGATAVLEGWRDATIDIDLKLVPDHSELLRTIQRLKEEHEVNVELASPDLFIPVSEGWQDRSPHVATVGPLVVRHFDLTAQALAKIERGHRKDLDDVAEMLRRGLTSPQAIRRELDRVIPELYRYPAVDEATLRRSVETILGPVQR